MFPDQTFSQEQQFQQLQQFHPQQHMPQHQQHMQPLPMLFPPNFQLPPFPPMNMNVHMGNVDLNVPKMSPQTPSRSVSAPPAYDTATPKRKAMQSPASKARSKSFDDEDDFNLDPNLSLDDKASLQEMRKYKKMSREKDKRAKLNDQFDQLCRMLQLTRSTRVEKIAVLTETIKTVRELQAENDGLKRQRDLMLQKLGRTPGTDSRKQSPEEMLRTPGILIPPATKVEDSAKPEPSQGVGSAKMMSVELLASQFPRDLVKRSPDKMPSDKLPWGSPTFKQAMDYSNVDFAFDFEETTDALFADEPGHARDDSFGLSNLAPLQTPGEVDVDMLIA